MGAKFEVSRSEARVAENENLKIVRTYCSSEVNQFTLNQNQNDYWYTNRQINFISGNASFV